MAKKPYTVTIVGKYPPYAPEAVLRMRAKNEDDAKRIAKEWLASPYTLFVENGHVKPEDLEEDVKIEDIVS